MSFSGDVKEELVNVLPTEAHCRLAELAALFRFYAKVEKNPEPRILLSADNSYALRKCILLLNKTFNLKADACVDENTKPGTVYELNRSNCEIDRLFSDFDFDNPMSLLKKDCCRRAYLRGAFLASGFVGDPQKGYHFELLTSEDVYARLLTYLISQFNISPKRALRKKYVVIYVKESEAVSDILNVLGAHKSMMDMANARIMKDVRNSVNRRNNCDMANIAKAVNAASKQIEDILLIAETVGLETLPESLLQMAEVRVQHPESSFTELGKYFDPPVGKSGVNHRLRKISEIADALRRERDTT